MADCYKSYPDYKDSGGGWLGTVPAHWDVKPLKYLARFNGGATPSKDNPSFWNGSIPWVSPKDMKKAKREAGVTSDLLVTAGVEE